MKIEDIEIHVGEPSTPYKEIKQIKAKVGAATIWSKTPTIEDVNYKLREVASTVGANAVVKVKYDRGVTMTSWKGLTATGVAVVISKENEQSQSRQPEQNIEPIEQRLGVLEDLKSRGLISEEEYMDKRNKILGDI